MIFSIKFVNIVFYVYMKTLDKIHLILPVFLRVWVFNHVVCTALFPRPIFMMNIKKKSVNKKTKKFGQVKFSR